MISNTCSNKSNTCDDSDCSTVEQNLPSKRQKIIINPATIINELNDMTKNRIFNKNKLLFIKSIKSFHYKMLNEIDKINNNKIIIIKYNEYIAKTQADYFMNTKIIKFDETTKNNVKIISEEEQITKKLLKQKYEENKQHILKYEQAMINNDSCVIVV